MARGDDQAEQQLAKGSLIDARRLLATISGAITLVLLPLALLAGPSRGEPQDNRLGALMELDTLEMRQILWEVEADTALTAGYAFGKLEPLITEPERANPRTSQGLVVLDNGRSRQGLSVLIQTPTGGGAERSLFSRPLGVGLVIGLCLLATALSLAIARSQQRLERLRVQERRAADRLQAVLHSAGIGTGLCHPSCGQFQSVNQALCHLLGRTARELEGQSWLAFCHADDRLAAGELLTEVLEGKQGAQRLRLRLQRSDGTSVWGDLALACIWNRQGEADTLIVQIADVTELVAQAAYVEAAAEAGIVGVWDWDIPRDVLTWDPVM
ncbi:MAG: PAS domain S-box protein [Cyanobacteriota bacterium]|nr:PAS domain S-box protein [Cyanobacteriota bacterium]